MSDRRDTILTTEGLEVRLRPLSRVIFEQIDLAVEREYRERGEPLDPPTYTAQTAGGGQETHPHDAESVRAEETSEAERQAWDAYLLARARLEAEVRERVSRYVLFQGVVAPDPPAEWVDLQRWLRVEVPDDPRDLKLRYIEAEILKTPSDLMEAMLGVLRLSMAGVPQADLEAMERFFRRALERHGAAAPADQAGAVDGQPAPAGDAGGEGVAPAPKRVGRRRGRGQGRDASGGADRGAHGGLGAAGGAAGDRGG